MCQYANVPITIRHIAQPIGTLTYWQISKLIIMKTLFLKWACLCIALVTVAPVCNAAKWKAKHVVLIGLDGWGAYSVEKANIPNIKQLMNDGSYTLTKRSVLPSSSAVNWASMFMGAGPEIHG